MSSMTDRITKVMMRGPIDTPAWVLNTLRDATRHIAALENQVTTDNSEVIRALEARIAELLAAIESQDIELATTRSALNICTQQYEARIKIMKAENQRLQRAIELCERCRPYAHGAGTCKKSLDDMAALLGGGE